MALFTTNRFRKVEKKHPNKLILYWPLGASIVSFVGAGFYGFADTLPQTNLYIIGCEEPELCL